jgi:NitT/TauT family transport system substrate-binding protein
VFLNLALAQAGLQSDDVSILGVGNAAGAIAAARSGRLGGISGVDPVMTELEMAGDIVLLADARTAEGSRAMYGGPYASGCLYAPADFIAKNPNVTQALANAMVRTLKWVKAAPVDQIVAALPAEYSRTNPALYRAALERNLPGIPDSGVVPEEAAKTVLGVVGRSDPKFDVSKIDLAKTYDNRFAQAALQKQR